MERDPDYPAPNLVQHPVTAIDRFLDDFDLEAEWVGIVGGPYVEDGEIIVSYNIRTVDGPYRDMLSADFNYRYNEDVSVDVAEVYPAQVTAIEQAFPEAYMQCYVPEVWHGD